jgi:hypothetical protein
MHVPAQPAPPVPISRPYVPAPIEQPSATGAGSKILSALLFLLLGAVVGAGGYYWWVKSQPTPVVETPVLTEMKSNNAPLTAFEEGRRLVDKDPAKYIEANAASPQVAEDYFLLGRAFMLTGKQWEAKKCFTDARNRLATADPNNAKTLAAEIAMAMAIIENGPATEAFTKDLQTANSTGQPDSNSNINTNTTRPIPTR